MSKLRSSDLKYFFRF